MITIYKLQSLHYCNVFPIHTHLYLKGCISLRPSHFIDFNHVHSIQDSKFSCIQSICCQHSNFMWLIFFNHLKWMLKVGNWVFIEIKKVDVDAFNRFNFLIRSICKLYIYLYTLVYFVRYINYTFSTQMSFVYSYWYFWNNRRLWIWTRGCLCDGAEM